MKDSFGRNIDYLRLSVTQRCNLKCIYCNPSACKDPTCREMTASEFEKIVQIMADFGIKRVRLTGGEPLIRQDIVEITKRISSIKGISDLSMTTNGIRLVHFAEELKKAGLMRVNISIDSLMEEKYSKLTGGRLSDVFKGIEASQKAGLKPLKLNVVLMEGINDDEISEFINLTKDIELDVRFIEMMPFNDDNKKQGNTLANTHIMNKYPQLQPVYEEYNGQPARYYKLPGYAGRVGFISPMSHKFCSCCNRIRITSDAKIRTCLGDNCEYDFYDLLKKDNVEGIKRIIEQAILNKPEGHNFGKKYVSNRKMNQIGG